MRQYLTRNRVGLSPTYSFKSCLGEEATREVSHEKTLFTSTDTETNQGRGKLCKEQSIAKPDFNFTKTSLVHISTIFIVLI